MDTSMRGILIKEDVGEVLAYRVIWFMMDNRMCGCASAEAVVKCVFFYGLFYLALVSQVD
jgi:hypothetical protein